MNPETTTFRTGRGYEDLPTLFRELHEGVLELGVGQCEVRSNDDPKRLLIGWELYTERDGVARWWDFEIRLTRVKATAPGGRLRELLATSQGRVEIAAFFEGGGDPATLLGDQPS